MIPAKKLKRMLAGNPDRLEEFLKSYGFANFRSRNPKYMSFGRDEFSSAKSIALYFDNMSVHDYAKGFHGDLIEYLKFEKDVEPEEAIVEMRRYLGVSTFTKSEEVGDIEEFENELDRTEYYSSDPNVIDESVLDEYLDVPNERFLNDGISLATQKKFGIRYYEEKQAIIIPIRRADGLLIGVKARFNRDVGQHELKYVYFEPCLVTKTLYGYDQLKETETIYIFEAEKSVMQADTMGINNCVALGSSSISQYQCNLIKKLQPKKIYLLTDKGLLQRVVEQDCEKINKIIENVEIYTWTPGDDVPDKASPTDLGKERFEKALREEMKRWNK